VKEQLEERLQTLQAEFKTGQTMLAELEGRCTEVRTTLVRISGAIQVLEELLQAAPEQIIERPPSKLVAVD
jgi:uncharacterized coiled-coil protein SlyX